jgi:hypothetical protein
MILTLLGAVQALATAAEENERKPELTFHASFDRFTTIADFSKGDPNASLNVSLELRSTEGVRKSGLLVEEGESCTYAVKDNLNMSAATASMWVCPKNWSGEDNRFHHFFGVADTTFRLSVYVPGNNTACLYLEFGDRNAASFRTLNVAAQVDWKVGEWHKIDACWDSTTLRIYVDGKLGEKKDLQGIEFPALQDKRFNVNLPWQGKTSTTHDRADLTVMDEVKLFDGVLSGEQISLNYAADQAALAGALPVSLARVPLTGEKITADGRLDEPAWKNAAQLPIRIKPNSFPHERESFALLLYGADALHLAFRAPLEGRTPVAEQVERDGRIWQDDSFEVILWPEDQENDDKRFHFIVNAKGAVYDAQGPVKEWNGNIESGGKAGETEWTVELSIPFASFGLDRPAVEAKWKANFCRNWWREQPTPPVFTAWTEFHGSYYNGKGDLVFGKENEGVKLALGDDFVSGNLQLAIGNKNKDKAVCVLDASGKGVQPIKLENEIEPASEKILNASLVGFKNGILSFSVTDAASGMKLAEYATRLYVKEPLEVEYIPDVLGKRLSLKIDFSNLDQQRAAALQSGKATLNVAITGPVAEACAKLSFPVKSMREFITFPIVWREGDYNFAFSLASEGIAPVTASGHLFKPDTAFLTANAGVTDQVLDPWTPMEYEKESVKCWGREYVLEGPFACSLKNQGAEQLAAPMRLTLATDAGEAELKILHNRRTSEKAHRAEWRGVGRFGELDGTVTWETWMEYDGLVVTDLTIYPPAGGWNVRSLALEIPLRGDLGKYIRNPKRVPAVGAAVTEQRGAGWDGVRWESGFEPYVWLGTEEEGFDWFFDSDANWLCEKPQAATVLEVSAEKAVLRFNIIAKAAKVDQPLTYRFGFEATPVRPLMKNWRGVHQNSHMMKHLNYIGYSAAQGTQFAYYDVAHPDLFRAACEKKLADPKKKDIPTLYYGGATCGPNKNKYYDFFKPLWDNPLRGGFYNTARGPSPLKPEGDPTPYDLVSVSQSSSYTDLLMWQAQELTKYPGVTSFYTDMDRLVPSANPLHGGGYVNDAFGRSGVSYCIVQRRQFYKRLLTIARNSPNGSGVYMAHGHDALILPYHAFADMFYPGEQYAHETFKKPYFYITDLDPVAWRVELASKASGINNVLLPQFERGTGDKQHRKVPEYTESLIAMCLVSDVVMSASWCNDPAMEQYWETRINTGIDSDEAEFVGYWTEDCPVKAGTENVLVSVYRLPGKIVVVAANRNEQPTEAKIALHVEKAGLVGELKITDERTQTQLTLADGSFVLPMKGYNYAIVTITKEAGE